MKTKVNQKSRGLNLLPKNGRLAQRLSPRRKNSHWTRFNMDRCMDLENRVLMTPAVRHK